MAHVPSNLLLAAVTEVIFALLCVTLLSPMTHNLGLKERTERKRVGCIHPLSDEIFNEFVKVVFPN